MRNPNDIRILIVDDEEDLREALLFDFKRKGFKTFGASNGHEAYDLIRANPIDLVITDVRMPNGDGVELLRRIKEQDPIFPVVMFLTGFCDLTLEDAYDLGAEAVLSKPFDRKELMASVLRAVSSKEEAWGHSEGSPPTRNPIPLPAISGKAIGFGRGGILVELQGAPPKADTHVSFQLETTPAQLATVEGVGIVRWTKAGQSIEVPALCGLEFLLLHDECRKRVIHHIEILKMKPFIPKC